MVLRDAPVVAAADAQDALGDGVLSTAGQTNRPSRSALQILVAQLPESAQPLVFGPPAPHKQRFFCVYKYIIVYKYTIICLDAVAMKAAENKPAFVRNILKIIRREDYN